jgi:hypothetical protein
LKEVNLSPALPKINFREGVRKKGELENLGKMVQNSEK